MPLFKNFIAYRIGPDWTPPDPHLLEDALQRSAFIPCGPTQPLSAGWVPPRGQDHGALLETQAGHWILRLAVERRAVPAAAVRTELEARCKAIEAEQGRKPGRKERSEIKDEIVQTLMPRAFSKRAFHWLWLAPSQRLLVAGVGSARAAEAVLQPLVDVMADLRHVLPLSLLNTAVSPAAAMAQWLSEQEPPPGFTLDRDLELKDPGEERAVVRYARHHLELDEIVQHIREGKRPTRLGLTWEGRVSFELTEALALRRLAMEGAEAPASGEDAFDADVAITTGELSALLPDLVQALGGELEPGQAAPPPVAPEAPAQGPAAALATMAD